MPTLENSSNQHQPELTACIMPRWALPQWQPDRFICENGWSPFDTRGFVVEPNSWSTLDSYTMYRYIYNYTMYRCKYIRPGAMHGYSLD